LIARGAERGIYRLLTICCDRASGLLPVTTVVDYIFLISLILTMLAIIGVFVPIPFVSSYAFWVVIAAYVMLASHRHYVIYRVR
jgi:hypothetical protein